MTPAVEPSKSASLISRLVTFKELYDADAPLEDVLPTTLAHHPERYGGYTLQRLCDEMHQFYRDHNIKELQRLCFRAEHSRNRRCRCSRRPRPSWATASITCRCRSARAGSQRCSP